MNCPSCGTATPADFRFCPSCGIALTPSPETVSDRGSDGRPTDAGTDTQAPGPAAPGPAAPGPAALGPAALAPAALVPGNVPDAGSPPPLDLHRIAEPRRPLAERRLVSVLFLDLVGFTTLSESLDPEDVREIQSRYFESARATVAHYGGSLEKFIGDAVMAVWGTPIAHEDDGERAVRTALEVVANVETLFAPQGGGHLVARGAVTTGEAAVTLVAEGEGMVTGDLVNTASRLQGAAEPGTVLVDEATRHVCGEAIAFEAAGELTLKGKASTVSAWRAVAVAPHVSSESRTGHSGPFVGRDAELRAVTELLTAVGEERRMRVVSLIGIAGIGKSRLVWELEHSVAVSETRASWYAGRAPAYGEGIAFAPLAEMLRRSAGIAESDPAEVARRALAETLGRLVPDAAERGWMEPRLLALLEPTQVAETQREELFAAWRRFFEADAEEAPTTLLFEDLQWADPGLLDFIDYLADWSRHHPILVLTLGRPELLDARPTWGAGLPHFTAMHLDRLADSAIDELLAALAPGLPPEITSRVRQRADGVPLYAVEMARMLTERASRAASDGAQGGAPEGGAHVRLSDAAPVEIPESLHALLAARIDALPGRERSLLLTAAVLGRRFRPEALGVLSGADRTELATLLRALMRREFLSMDDEPRSPGRGQLSFVQELVREVAYHTLSRRERRAQHLAVIDYLESLDEPDLVEPIAEHLLAAHAATGPDQPDAPAIAERARRTLVRAAGRAQELHAPQRALAHLERALALTDDPSAQAELDESAGLAARAAARYAVAEGYLRDAIALRESGGDTVGAARHRAQLASLLLQAQRSDTALTELEAAWSATSGGPDGAAMALEVPAELARAYLLRGDPPEAIDWAEKAIAAAEAAGETTAARSVAIDARVTLGTARAGAGSPEEGMAQLRQAIDDAEAAGLGSIEVRALNNLAWVMVSDDPRATGETARRGLELAERLGIRELALQLLDVATIVAIETGDWQWARDALEEATSGELPTVYRLDFAATRTILNALRGVDDPASPIESLGTFEPDLDPQALGWVDHARAMVALTAGDLAAALDLARTAARRTAGFERSAALALAGRVAAWGGEADAAGEALGELEAMKSWGRAAEATRLTLAAAVAGLVNGAPRSAASAGEGDEWMQPLAAWRDLGLPYREGLCHLDRWRLGGKEEDRDAAAQIFGRLGATPLVRLVTEPVAER